MKEIAWVEDGEGNIIQFKIGKETEVEFDLLDLWLNYRHECLSFFHTHPFEETPHLSGQDTKCIEAIKLLFGEHRRCFGFIVVGTTSVCMGSIDNNEFYTNYYYECKLKYMMEISQCV